MHEAQEKLLESESEPAIIRRLDDAPIYVKYVAGKLDYSWMMQG